jgi:hypothetical protein
MNGDTKIPIQILSHKILTKNSVHHNQARTIPDFFAQDSLQIKHHTLHHGIPSEVHPIWFSLTHLVGLWELC